MPYRTKQSEYVIRGRCSLFVCRCCRTKYGWEHQVWCDTPELLEPVCTDCYYYNARRKHCAHPAHKMKRRDMPDEKAQHPI